MTNQIFNEKRMKKEVRTLLLLPQIPGFNGLQVQPSSLHRFHHLPPPLYHLLFSPSSLSCHFPFFLLPLFSESKLLFSYNFIYSLPFPSRLIYHISNSSDGSQLLIGPYVLSTIYITRTLSTKSFSYHLKLTVKN